ncbi:MAG: prepilin-type N-terminal cleavage/methylation domain-containing protein [Candidatus Pacebacteria bacterium]|nr:prepilin-type N-terminal cleavage/methylation domain-containing protein [Candidatus Paceibacterota bacterium]
MKTMLNKQKLVNARNHRSTLAFTLIELILVMAIIA